MINQRSSSAKSLVVNILRRVLAILGCLLFVFSFITPFYYGMYIGSGGRGGSTYYWSFKADGRIYFLGASHFSQFWFSDYWFSDSQYIEPGIHWTLISMFTVQALTLVFGVASVIFDRRILSSASVLLSLAVMALMTYAGEILSGYQRGLFYGEHQLGYYLMFASVVLFLSAFTLAEVKRKRK